MNYYEKLNLMIEKSNLTLKEIAEKCMLYGVSINPSYISKLRSGKQPPASDDVNIAIAKACGFEKQIEDFLFEAYLEKSPEYIKDLLTEIINFFSNTAKSILKKQVPPNLLPIIEEQFNQLTGYKVIKNTLSNADLVNNVTIEPVRSIRMPDDSMEPLIPKDALLQLEQVDEIKNGDIIVASTTDSHIVKKYIAIENKVVLVSLKQDIETIILDSHNLKIIGRVKYVMNEI
ncbi:hypothetical protein COL27_20695 [Bacillus sp. AFS075960]|nr:hypothetical protein COL27_20695 [Bacillus sp. AFS075960]